MPRRVALSPWERQLASLPACQPSQGDLDAYGLHIDGRASWEGLRVAGDVLDAENPRPTVPSKDW